jgi:hypothetical protein
MDSFKDLLESPPFMELYIRVINYVSEYILVREK